MTDASLQQRILTIATEFVRANPRSSGSKIGQHLYRELPPFQWPLGAYRNLRELLERTSSALVIVGRSGQDVVWELAERVADDELDSLLTMDDAPGEATDAPPVGHLTSLHLKHFRSCRDTLVHLEPLTILVGANGAGKTSILQALFLGAQGTRPNPGPLFTGPRRPDRLLKHGEAGPIELTVRVADAARGTLVVRSSPRHGEAAEVQWKNLRGKELLRDRCWPALLLRLDANAAAAPAYTSERPTIRHDGYGLSSVIAAVAASDPDRLAEIVRRVQQIIPTFRRVRAVPRTLEPWQRHHAAEDERFGVPWHLEVEMEGLGWVPGDLLSEGTLVALALIVILTQARPPRLVLIDDVDRGLHPLAQGELTQMLHTIAHEHGVQIVATTHSPFVLGYVAPSAVQVVAASTAGTRSRPLIEHPEWAEWADTMRAGEFWNWQGEDWVAESGS